MQTLDQINQDYVSCKRKRTLVEEINASLYSQDNYKLKKQYTSNQKLLAQHKINVQDSLGEVRQEMQDILKHLKNNDNSLELRHIHRMAEIIPEMQKYQNAAIRDFSAYCTVRQRLISFADKEDIDFIVKYTSAIRTSTTDIVNHIGKMINDEQQELRYSKTSDNLPNTLISLSTIKCYVQQVEQAVVLLEQQYSELLEKIYHCSIEELLERFHSEFDEVTREFNTYHLHGKIWGINLSEQLLKDSKELTIDLKGIQKIVARVLQDSIPEFSVSDFWSSPEDLAQKITNNKLTHDKTNQLFVSYNILQHLEHLKDPAKKKKKRGPKEQYLFDNIDQDMLREVFTNLYEEEKTRVPKPNIFATLFLIAMTNNHPDFLDRKLATCYRFISNIVSDFQLVLRTMQRTLRQYIENTCKPIWREVVDRIIAKIQPLKLQIITR